jgi:hypothetical protein
MPVVRDVPWENFYMVALHLTRSGASDGPHQTYREIYRSCLLRRLVVCSLLLLGVGATAADEVVEKSMFLVVEDDRIIASNVQTGQFFDFDFSAKEKMQQQIVANGVAIVVTNQRYAGIGVFSGGWQSIRRIAGESVISAEAQDYSALVVTSDRVLAFNGKTGSWSDRKR